MSVGSLCISRDIGLYTLGNLTFDPWQKTSGQDMLISSKKLCVDHRKYCKTASRNSRVTIFKHLNGTGFSSKSTAKK